MLYALILTTYMYGDFDNRPAAVTQTSTPGFTSEQLCVNAGKVAQAGSLKGTDHHVVVLYQCAPLTL